MDEFNIDSFKDDAEDDAIEMGGYKEYLVILIDAQPDMMEPCTLEDKMFHGMSWLEASVTIASAILRTKVIQGGSDESSVIFYNTSSSKNQMSVENIYAQQGMGPPDAGRVSQLKNFTLKKDFNSKIGAGSSEEFARSNALESGLLVATNLLPARATTGVDVFLRRVLVFTRDATLGTPRSSMETRAQNLGTKGALLQLAPLYNPQTGEGFDLTSFWEPVLSLAAASHPNAAALADQKDGYEEEEENVLSLESLSSVVRMRAYRKRAITRIPWTITEGSTIGVKLYATIHKAWPAAKGTAVQLDACDNKPLVKPKPIYLDAQSGAPLEEGQKARLYYPAQVGGSLPTQYAQDVDEIRQLKFPATKGLSLLGYKPVEDLKPWHQLRETTFIFPDEAKVSGSLVAFTALHEAMLERKVMAVCTLVRGPSAEPRLVALVAQREESNPETGAMITPAGMHMFYLPFADDIRYPELDTAFTGTSSAQPSQAAVDAAAELVAALDLGDDFNPGDIPNPHMQHWFKKLEEKAITLEAENEDSDGDDAAGSEDADEDLVMKGTETAGNDSNVVEDLAVPDAETFSSVENLVDRFIAAVCAPAEEGNLTGQPKKKGTKRPAGSDVPKLSGGDLSAAVDALNIPGKFAAGSLASLKNDDLKLYLESVGLKKTGVKAELVQRIKDHLEKQ